MQVKFSILVPAYKRRFLRECLKSIFVQTYENFEVIIVNDASPESLDEVVREFNDSRIRYFENERNSGIINVVDNWNICLSRAIGDYTMCIGDDDKLLPNCLEEYVKLVKKYPNLGVYHAWTEIIDENGVLCDMQEPRPEFESVFSMIYGRWKNNRIQYIGDFLFNTQLLKENGGFYKLPLACGSDDITAYIAAEYHGIANSQIPLFQYRDNVLTITKNGDRVMTLNAILDAEKWYKSFLLRKRNIENKQERIFHKLCEKELLHHFNREKINVLISDINGNGFLSRSLFWFLNRRKFGLSIKIIIISIVKSLGKI